MLLIYIKAHLRPFDFLQVVGHIKTVIILMGGCLFFGDEMPLKKLAGISVAMVGIVWYSQVSLSTSCMPHPVSFPSQDCVPVPDVHGSRM